ncbi:MAG: phosphoribosylanthranilate isomerase [Actinobacteria bacterium]|nr:phosphoribosylanthranilate isomerase [Actinomycetota bacterium]
MGLEALDVGPIALRGDQGGRRGPPCVATDVGKARHRRVSSSRSGSQHRAFAGVYRGRRPGRTTVQHVLPDQRIKFCGVTHPTDVHACVLAGAWAIGAVMSPHGPRALDARTAVAVMAEVPGGVERVGVFVDAAPDDVARAVDACGLTRVQLHGDVDIAAVATAAGVPVAVAVPLEDAASIELAEALECDLVLFDAAVTGAHGGTGVRADWTLLERRRPRRPFALAGGLTPEVVGDAVRRVRPFVLDVSSGVEGDVVGRKDAGRVRAFADAARAAAMEEAA